MMTATLQDFQTRPAAIRRQLARGPATMLLANGKPFALVTPVTGSNAAEVSTALRMARAQLAIRALRRRAAENGTAGMKAAELDAVIADTRAKRRAHQQPAGR